MSYIYSLRYALQPGRDNTKRIQDLIQFCDRAKIDEINFFINHEEINRGHLTLEDNKVWVQLSQELKDTLATKNIRFSINPGTTLMHGDRGRVLNESLKFSLMVDADGTQAKAVACPLDPRFHEYLSNIYQQLATTKPDLLWIEDDIRHHNHRPVNWGCFCDQHMAEFSKRIGKTVDRETLVEAILKEGSPHPYRKIYLDLCQEAITDLFKTIHHKVKLISPHTKLALMTSQPSQHAVEGRNWDAIFDALSQEDARVARPHLPSYNEVTPKTYSNEFNSYVRTASVLIGEGAELYPELENYMYSRYAKSNRFSEMQLKTAMVMNPIGTTMNLFDMMGTGLNFDDHLDTLLHDLKPYLSTIKDLDLKVSNQRGIVCLFDERASYHIELPQQATRADLIPHETMWMELLGAFGIAYRPSTDYRSLNHEIVAISGQYLQNLNSEEIQTLFQNNFVMLDGESAHILHTKGLLHLIGAKSGYWSPERAGFQTYEQVDNGEIIGGVEEARMTLMQQIGPTYMLEYDKGGDVITHAYNEYQECLGPCMVQGKQCFVMPISYHPTHRWNGQYIGFKAEIIKNMLQRIDEKYNKPLWIDNAPFTNLVHVHQDGNDYIYTLNFSTDSYACFDIQGADLLEMNEVNDKGIHRVNIKGQCVLTDLPYLDMKVFKLKIKTE